MTKNLSLCSKPEKRKLKAGHPSKSSTAESVEIHILSPRQLQDYIYRNTAASLIKLA